MLEFQKNTGGIFICSALSHENGDLLRGPAETTSAQQDTQGSQLGPFIAAHVSFQWSSSGPCKSDFYHNDTGFNLKVEVV